MQLPDINLKPLAVSGLRLLWPPFFELQLNEHVKNGENMEGNGSPTCFWAAHASTSVLPNPQEI